jgi:hypothetical protein
MRDGHRRPKAPVTLLVHGACCMKKGTIELCGADRWAEEWARERQVPYLGMPARWTADGNGADPWRNGRMAALPGVGGVLGCLWT